jgi:hypothetical protein
MLYGSHDVLLITDPRFKATHLCPVNILFAESLWHLGVITLSRG